MDVDDDVVPITKKELNSLLNSFMSNMVLTMQGILDTHLDAMVEKTLTIPVPGNSSMFITPCSTRGFVGEVIEDLSSFTRTSTSSSTFVEVASPSVPPPQDDSITSRKRHRDAKAYDLRWRQDQDTRKMEDCQANSTELDSLLTTYLPDWIPLR